MIQILYIKAGLYSKQVKYVFNFVIFQLISFLCCKKKKKMQEKAPMIFEDLILPLFYMVF